MVLTLTLLIIAPGIAISQEVHYVFQEYTPANYLDKQGRPAGFFVDIMHEAIENRLGLNLQISIFPWRRCQVLVEQGKADLMTTVPTPARLEYAKLVNVPIWIKQYRIYTYQNHPRMHKMQGIRSIAEILQEHFTVISYIGNSWATTNLEGIGIPLLKATSVDGMYRMLVARRGDIFVDDPVLVANSLPATGLENQIVLTQGCIEESAFYPLVSKRSHFAARTEDFAKVLQEMWDDGTIDAIMKPYL